LQVKRVDLFENRSGLTKQVNLMANDNEPDKEIGFLDFGEFIEDDGSCEHPLL
jgi:hypothetical protein